LDILLNQIETAANSGLSVLALQGALSVPDICGALEDVSGQASGKRYIAWFDSNLGSKYQAMIGPSSGKHTVFLDGATTYHFRCSFVHQGKTNHPKSKYSKIVFIVSPKVYMHNCIVAQTILAIDVKLFCIDVVLAARTWFAKNQNNSVVQKNIQDGIRFYPQGIPSLSVALVG
jgi:hypothetical protein